MIIKKIIDTFYQLSKEHKLVRSFVYNRVSKAKGTGEQLYPQVFLEDPIYIRAAEPLQGKIPVQVNFDITCLPQAFNNLNTRQLTEEECQNVCHQIALHFVAKLRELNRDFNTRNDDSSGVRCTLDLLVDNDIQLCDLDEHFDPDKEFDLGKLLADVDSENAAGCVTFDYKLPKIKL